MKKLLVLMLALALVFAFAACGAQEEAPVAAEEGQEEAGITMETIKVGFVFIGDEADQGYSYAHIQGVKEMQNELGLADDQIVCKYNIPEGNECETAVRELVEAGCNLIVCNSFGHEDYMQLVAADYPEIQFCHISGYQASNLENCHNCFGHIYQARYLTGIVAGLATQTNVLGYVTAMPFAECISGYTAFYLGAKSVNPDVTMNVLYTNSWSDATLESQAAQALIDSGADVLGQHADTTATQTTAEAKGVYSVGYNSDMSAAAPKANLASAVWHWGPCYTYVVNAFVNGEEIANDITGDLATGMVDIVLNEELLTELGIYEEAVAAVEAAKEAIIAGELNVFEGPLVGADGETVLAEGEVFYESAEASAPSWANVLEGCKILDQAQ